MPPPRKISRVAQSSLLEKWRPTRRYRTTGAIVFSPEVAHRVGGQDLDPGEDIEVLEVAVWEVANRIACGDINHSLVAVALAFALYIKSAN
jgi:hypothetical protein